MKLLIPLLLFVMPWLTAAATDSVPDCPQAPAWWRWEHPVEAHERGVLRSDPVPRCDSVSPACVRFALSTNLLMDAFLLPEVQLHVAFARHCSVAAGWRGAWWSVKRRQQFWQTWGGHLTGRWHFGRAHRGNTLAGHHLGLRGAMFGYDFKLGERGRQCRGLGTWSVAVEYGYSIAVARRLDIDVSAGFGYLDSPHTLYKYECGQYVCSGNRHRRWWGPVSGEISLVWLIGPGNFNPPYLYK